MKLQIENGFMNIQLSAIEKILSLHGDFHIGLRQITGVSAGQPKADWLDLRFPGTFVPWLIKAGTYITTRGKEFWYADLRKKDKYLTFELQGNSYKRIVVTIDGSHKFKAELEKVIK